MGALRRRKYQVWQIDLSRRGVRDGCQAVRKDDHGTIDIMNTILTSFILTTAAVLLLAAILTLLPRLGSAGKSVSDKLARAPALDVVIALLTWVPWLVAGLAAGWLGLLGTLPGQAAALLLWVTTHELLHREAVRGPTIFRALNELVGRWRNHTALWVTLVALPLFWFIRLHQIFLYPVLVWLLGFPRHKQADWINVSRQKFDGLVGHDLIWCLYCDWMTGVYALGAELLRTVESFWCPIRFHSGKKCENCKLDFPDLEHGWVPADGTMHEVSATLHAMYGDGRREWFGHRDRPSDYKVRLTVLQGQRTDRASHTPAVSEDAESSPQPETHDGKQSDPRE